MYCSLGFLSPWIFLSIHVSSWTFWSTWICSFNAILLLISIIYDASFCSWKVLEQILGVLIKLVKEIKLQHQYRYVSLVGLSNACLENLFKLSWWHVWTVVGLSLCIMLFPSLTLSLSSSLPLSFGGAGRGDQWSSTFGCMFGESSFGLLRIHWISKCSICI